MIPRESSRTIQLDITEWNQLSAALSSYQRVASDSWKVIQQRIKKTNQRVQAICRNREIPVCNRHKLLRLPEDLLRRIGLYEILHNPPVDEDWARLAVLWIDGERPIRHGAPADPVTSTVDPGVEVLITSDSQGMPFKNILKGLTSKNDVHFQILSIIFQIEPALF